MRFEDLLKLEVGMGCCIEDYIFIYGLVSLIKPITIVEIGTNYGVGTITMALALKENNIYGKIHTFDIVPKYTEKARKQAELMNVSNYINFNIGNSDNVKKLNIKKFDLGFIDGDHTYEGVKKDFENLKDICDYIIFHDTDVCDGVKRFIKELEGEKLEISKCLPGITFKGKINHYFNGIALWRKNNG